MPWAGAVSLPTGAQPALAATLGAADEKMARQLLALLLLLQPGRAAAEAGLKLTVYDNTGRAVSAATKTTIVDGPVFNVSSDKPFSAELEGTITFNESGIFEFFWCPHPPPPRALPPCSPLALP
eukprot:COSAG04_NODE_10800_length_752_cov_1.007657_1_plen_124_part_00